MQVSKQRVAGMHDQGLRQKPLHRWYVANEGYVRQAHPQVRVGTILGYRNCPNRHSLVCDGQTSINHAKEEWYVNLIEVHKQQLLPCNICTSE